MREASYPATGRRVTVVGLGYVGLTTALTLAHWGHSVDCVDVDTRRLSSLSQGQVPFHEPALSDVLQTLLPTGRLKFIPFHEWGHWQRDAIFIAVNTPLLASPSPDWRQEKAPLCLDALQQVIQQIALFANRPQTILLKSTLPPGTTAQMTSLLSERSAHLHRVAHLPEFLRQGQAWQDALQPSRVVVGTHQPQEVVPLLQDLMAPVAPPQVPWQVLSPEAAELAKLVTNATLALKISWANEVAALCDALSVPASEVLSVAGSDPRIGSWGLQPGIGFGGSCLPKDSQALATLVGSAESMPLLQAALQRNQQQGARLLDRLKTTLQLDSWQGVKLAVWGVSFKGGTADLRHSPALSLVDTLSQQGALLTVHQPEGLAEIKAVLGQTVAYAEDPVAACHQASALLVLSDWAAYQTSDWSAVATQLKHPLVADGRHCLSSSVLAQHGLTRIALGQPAPKGNHHEPPGNDSNRRRSGVFGVASGGSLSGSGGGRLGPG